MCVCVCVCVHVCVCVCVYVYACVEVFHFKCWYVCASRAIPAVFPGKEKFPVDQVKIGPAYPNGSMCAA